MRKIFEIGYEDDETIFVLFQTGGSGINTIQTAQLLASTIRTVARTIQTANKLSLGEKEQIEAQILRLVYEDVAGGGDVNAEFKKV